MPIIVDRKYGFSKYNICYWNKLNIVETSFLLVGIKKLNFSMSDFIIINKIFLQNIEWYPEIKRSEKNWEE